MSTGKVINYPLVMTPANLCLWNIESQKCEHQEAHKIRLPVCFQLRWQMSTCNHCPWLNLQWVWCVFTVYHGGCRKWGALEIVTGFILRMLLCGDDESWCKYTWSKEKKNASPILFTVITPCYDWSNGWKTDSNYTATFKLFFIDLHFTY